MQEFKADGDRLCVAVAQGVGQQVSHHLLDPKFVPKARYRLVSFKGAGVMDAAGYPYLQCWTGPEYRQNLLAQDQEERRVAKYPADRDREVLQSLQKHRRVVQYPVAVSAAMRGLSISNGCSSGSSPATR